MTKSQEERIVLEISPVIEAEDYIELKYNLSAIMSGLATENCFQVEITDSSFADVFYSDGEFKIDLVDGDLSTSYVTSSFEDAMMFISGEDDFDVEESPSEEELIEEIIEEMGSLVEYYSMFESKQEFKTSSYEQLECLYASLGRILGR